MGCVGLRVHECVQCEAEPAAVHKSDQEMKRILAGRRPCVLVIDQAGRTRAGHVTCVRACVCVCVCVRVCACVTVSVGVCAFLVKHGVCLCVMCTVRAGAYASVVLGEALPACGW